MRSSRGSTQGRTRSSWAARSGCHSASVRILCTARGLVRLDHAKLNIADIQLERLFGGAKKAFRGISEGHIQPAKVIDRRREPLGFEQSLDRKSTIFRGVDQRDAGAGH